jgi:integrase
LDQITPRVLDEYRIKRLAGGAKAATVNRDLEVVRAVLRKAHEWGMVSAVPTIRKLPEPTRRVRFLTHDEAVRLLEALPEYLSNMAAFSLATGLRESNVTGLRWDQVDLTRRIAWIHADEHKTRKALAVPLNADAVVILRRVERDHPTYVFVRSGQPKQGSSALRPTRRVGSSRPWRDTLKRLGIDDFRWHDLRHTWASWHVQAGTPLSALQELGGWSTYDMVRRYAAFAADHLAGYAENVAGPRLIERKVV